ncbi:MAG: universal stress protein [Saprospiraceae bacterium]
MKNILVPTDFSDNAMSAFRFALEMAPVLRTNIDLVHVYPLPDTEVAGGIRLHEAEEKWMDEFLRTGLAGMDTPVRVSARLLQGITEGQLVRNSASPDVEMMVMGAEGSGGIGKKWFGSIAETVARQAHCPVMLIPEGVSFKGFHHILFASDYTSADPGVLDMLVNFAGRFHASIHFVHVEKPGEGAEYAKIEQRIMDYLFRNGAPAFSFQMTCVHADRIAEGLSGYAGQNHIGLIVMVASQRSFWETLFRHSYTKEMILRSRIPLMVFHMKNQQS